MNEEQIRAIRNALADIVPIGTPWVLVVDPTTFEDQASDNDSSQWTCLVETIEPDVHSYVTIRGMLAYANDIRRQNYAVVNGEES
ncbi:MAG: hypothetical protein LKI88_00720 [Bifidobacterium sp.]|jgi:hypothetical protein|nr:hypothetical protein [Bifidobacterium sp.]MCI1864453.1 hypothetical protein [Bifidobacterium sp.]